MRSEKRHAQAKARQLVWIAGLAVLPLALLLGSATRVALASSNEFGTRENTWAISFQSTPTATLQVQSSSPFTFSLASLGYAEKILTSPYDQTQFSFSLPENWVTQADSALELDLSYTYHQFDTQDYPALFADLRVALDGETLEVFSIDKPQPDHQRLRVPLPPSLLSSSNRTRHVIELVLDAGALCTSPYKAKLVIHPTSTISLSYTQRPLVLDLARYPRPFYQQSFEPDSVRFVLPSRPTTDGLNNSLGIAAKLGDLTGGRLLISTTTDLDLSSLLSAGTPLDEHLFVIGRPQDNRLIPLLNDTSELPVSLHQQRLQFVTQGPTTVAPGDTLTYLFTVTNTLGRGTELSLVDPLPPFTQLVDCAPRCTKKDDDKTITWNNRLLAPGDTFKASLSLKATNTLTGSVLENTITLLETDLGPVNADTLVAAVKPTSSDSHPQVSMTQAGEHFFVYDGAAVPEGDGIIQEILSPWGQNRAVLIVTGLTDEAVRKASQAMSTETRLPGMTGEVALVQDASPPHLEDEMPAAVVEMTLADLGYPDQHIKGGVTTRQVDYFFTIPYGWRLTDDASIDLYFNHSRLIDYTDSGLTVLLNSLPIANAAFNEETAQNGHLHVSLADANVRWGNNNRLSVAVDMSMAGVCVSYDQAWAVIKDSSKLLLAHDVDTRLELDLNSFPYPFHLNPTLSDVLFALPDEPNVNELESALRLAARLGDSAAGDSTAPTGMLGMSRPAEDLANYHVIAMGRPSRNALIQHINEQLPQSFLPGSDDIEQRLDGVVFRLPRGIDLGYAQLIPSPWDETHVLLAVTGTTDKSVAWVVNALVDRIGTLGRGNLALVQGSEIRTVDTRGLTRSGLTRAMATAMPGMAAVATPMAPATATPTSPSTPTPGASASQRPAEKMAPLGWLIPALVVTGGVAIALIGVAVWHSRQRTLKGSSHRV